MFEAFLRNVVDESPGSRRQTEGRPPPAPSRFPSRDAPVEQPRRRIEAQG
jgi:hypothetical protein